jgi:fructose-specific phosphotransferase system IIC component
MITFIILFSVVLAIGTILVGIAPPETKYGAKTKKNIARLLFFYGASAIAFLIILYYFR